MKISNLSILIYLVIILNSLSAIDFNLGPYGQNYFDTAGQFSLPDLNANLNGDANQDGTLNIQDIILYVNHILGNIPFSVDQLQVSDLTDDGIINIMDITDVVFNIVNDIGAQFNFRDSWDGEHSYIFIHYNTGVPNSTALWNSNTKEEFLVNSPDNVHYFFLSEGNNPEQNIQEMKTEFDAILSNFTIEEQNHWNNHLHYISQRASTINNWISEVLVGKHSFGIDRFQRIKQIGYLGNPNGFTGTYLSYLANEAQFYNYEFNAIYEPEADYDELTIFDQRHYTGGWAASISELVEFPTNDELDNYSGMSVELLRGCPDSEGNYDDDGCDDYDRLGHLYVYEGACYEQTEYSWLNDEYICSSSGFYWVEGSCISYTYYENETLESCQEANFLWDFTYERHEIARWITPFDRQPHHLTDISQFLALLRPGGTKMIYYTESGWPNSLLTLKLRFYRDDNIQENPKKYIPMWNGSVQFNSEYDENTPSVIVEVPENATKVEFVSYITGHGWGDMTCFNCAEFCNSRHLFDLNGGSYQFSKDFPEANSINHCQSIDMISQGTIPNQYGTWGYGRAGWCPGMDVTPIIFDLTNHVEYGSNILDYNACHVLGTSCETPPGCGTCGYCPVIPMSSYIIISY